MGAVLSGDSSSVKPLVLSEIASIKLEPADNTATSPVTLENIWGDCQCLIIHVVRRPGCPLCREHAQSLAELMTSTPDGIKLIAAVHEKEYTDDLVVFRKYFLGNAVFFDKDKAIFRALGDRWSGLEVYYIRLN